MRAVRDPASNSMGFSAIDYIVLVAYLVGITIFGVLFRKSQQTVKDYFVGAKNINWVVISLSIVATETSTLTLIGVPAIAYASYQYPEQGGNFTYLQVVVRLHHRPLCHQLSVHPGIFQRRYSDGLQAARKPLRRNGKEFCSVAVFDNAGSGRRRSHFCRFDRPVGGAWLRRFPIFRI